MGPKRKTDFFRNRGLDGRFPCVDDKCTDGGNVSSVMDIGHCNVMGYL